jgi:hypothetical protein
MSRGPGWWLASDGAWYPPELHPGYVSPRQPPAAAAPNVTVTRFLGAHVVALVLKTIAWLSLVGGGLVTWRIVVHLQSSFTATATTLQAAAASAGVTVLAAAVLFFFGYVLELLRAIAESASAR